MVAYSGNFDVLRLLVDKGAKLIAQNRAGDCLLHISIRMAHTEFSKKVIALCQSMRFQECALDIENVQEKLTPYMLAVLREQFEVADLLVAANMAEPLYVNKDGENVEAIAERLCLPVSLEYLGVHKNKIDQIIEQKRGPPKMNKNGGA